MTTPTILDQPELPDVGVEAELAELLAEAANGLDVSDVIREKVPNSMVRMGGKPLPERTVVYDRDGNPSSVPTATIRYHLTKPRAGTNERAFYLKPPVDAVKAVPIDETCEDCTKARGGVPRPFYDQMDLELHREYKHPRETAIRERAAERKRGEVSFLSTVAAMTEAERDALRALLGMAESKPRATVRKED